MEFLWFLFGGCSGAGAACLYWKRVMEREFKEGNEQLIVLRARAIDLRSELDASIERNYKQWEELCVRLGVDPTFGRATTRRGGES